jgi:hypothetical protein
VLLRWSLRRIEEAHSARRETASGYLKAAGLAVCGRGRPPGRRSKSAIAEGVSTDTGAVFLAAFAAAIIGALVLVPKMLRMAQLAPWLRGRSTKGMDQPRRGVEDAHDGPGFVCVRLAADPCG